MQHTYKAGKREAARQANLMGALALTVSDRMLSAAEAGAGRGGSAPAALVSLAEWLDGASVAALRDPLALTHSAAVRVVDGLAGAGLVRRRRGADRRSVAVRLTPAGRRAAARATAMRAQTLEQALSVLTDDERAELARLHDKVLGALVDSHTSARRSCRLCDVDACGHRQGRCPTTRAADSAEARR